MHHRESLFNLIKSLTKQEKRYFVLYASRHLLKGESNYLKIFEAIAKQKEYDEAALKRMFSDQNFIRNFPGTKYHLYNLILKSLHSFHLNSTVEAQLGVTFDSANILLHKGLLGQAEKIADRGIEKAEKFQKLTRLIDFLQLKLSIYSKRNFEKVSEADIKRLTKRQAQVTDRYTTLIRYNELLLCLTKLYYKNSVIRNDGDWKKFAVYFNDPLIKRGEPKSGFYERFYYYLIIGLYCDLKNLFDQGYKNTQKLLDLLHRFPYAIKDKPDNYLRTLFNYCISSIDSNNIKEAKYALDQLNKFDVFNNSFGQSNSDIENLRLTLYISGYTYLVSTERNFSEGIRHLEEIFRERKLESIISDPFILNQVRYNLSGIYFYLGKFKKSLGYINELINETTEDYLRPVYRSSRLLQILILFEMGSYDVLSHLILSLRRHLKKNKELYPVEKTLVDFIEKQILSSPSAKETIKSFMSLRDQLRRIRTDNNEEEALQILELDFWIESKIQNKPIIQVLSDSSA